MGFLDEFKRLAHPYEDEEEDEFDEDFDASPRPVERRERPARSDAKTKKQMFRSCQVCYENVSSRQQWKRRRLYEVQKAL